MSRLIVKNLPKTINEDKLRNLFGSKGTITDIQLKYTKEGIFRQFAFIGYQTEKQAESALKYFNNSCIQTNKIKVEICAPLGAENKPKAWSKYSNESSAFKKIHGFEDENNKRIKEKENEKRERNEKKKTNLVDEIVGDYKNDPEFQEFMEVHSKSRTLWNNDANIVNEIEEKKINEEDVTKSKDIKTNFVNETNNQSSSDLEDNNRSDSNEDSSEKIAEKEISDLEYMKILMKKKSEQESKIKNESKTSKKEFINLHTIKIHNLPYKLKRSDIIKFFKPLNPYSIRLPTKVHGFCYVGFKTEKEFNKAMLKNKSFIKKKQIFFSDFTEKNKITKAKKDSLVFKNSNLNKNENKSTNSLHENPKWSQQEESIKNEEDISESGKIFFRNLSYLTTEDELQKLFEKYGPIAEINLPIDPLTRQIKGFGTVTFVMPEHAVLAFSELDGTLFQGRLLHLIPGKSKDKEDIESEENLGYKAKKILELKKSANSSHNWNTLFLGANAVADILSKRLNTTKEAFFDTEKNGFSAAVRLALGETEIVLEMKKFLEENDVQLDVFDSIPKSRSKTVILAKNLPAETTVSELRPLFSKFGLIGRFLLPPSGVTAIIEFLDPSESKKAFKNLAYSKFKNLPLYLEWAPENTFKTKINEKDIKLMKDEHARENKNDEVQSTKENSVKIKEPEVFTKEAKEITAENKIDENNDDEEPEAETTLFLKNLNFKTKENTVYEHFKHLGSIHIVQVATKKDPNDPKKKISLGYGFIQFKKHETAQKALKEMQLTKIEGNQVELKRSDRTLKAQIRPNLKKTAQQTKQTGTKILVKNIPFEAKPKEIEDIFKTFGELRSVRLPKKMSPGENTHRGFGFVDFITKSDAKKAFDALCQSTHLYNRRLILEWAAIDDNNVDELRKRTAEHFSGDSTNNIKKSRKAVFDTSKVVNIEKENE